ncbi:MAG: hypothetical protein KIS68_06645 [Bauldia sp.]|nr:hypothetical protein [Bauldia sp.]
MIGNYWLEGHALVSGDDRIADAAGRKPPELNHPLDWARFQAELHQAAVVVLGRKSHESDPGRPGRRRLVMSSSVRGIERRGDAWWWNPAEAELEEALAVAAPGGGLVAIPGGMRVFDTFLSVGYDAFHLARLPAVTLPGGMPVFSACDQGDTAEGVLAEAGLALAEMETLDPEVGLTVEVWRR